MARRELFSESAVELNLAASSKDEALGELVGLLGGSTTKQASLLRKLRRRENMGSTGIGRSIAIPHCRSDAVGELQLAYGRKPGGLEFGAIDGAPVRHFFLIVAPPVEVSNQYLKVLAAVAHFAKDPAVPDLLCEISEVSEFLDLVSRRRMNGWANRS